MLAADSPTVPAYLKRRSAIAQATASSMPATCPVALGFRFTAPEPHFVGSA